MTSTWQGDPVAYWSDTEQAQQDREHRDYMNLLTLIEGASSDRLGSVAWRVKRFITPESNFVYAQALVQALQKRALHVLLHMSPEIPQAPLYASHAVERVTEAVLEATEQYETMVNNVSDEG